MNSKAAITITHGGCYPIEDFIDGFWQPASEYSDF